MSVIEAMQENNLDEVYQMQCNEDYSVTTEDLKNYSSSGYPMVCVKSEPFDYDSEELLDVNECFASRAVKQEILEENNVQTEARPVYSHYDIIHGQITTERDFRRLITEEILQRYTGFPYETIFTEVLEYINYALIELEDTPKSVQLLSVLTKLHTNIDACFVDPFRFPSIYVSVVDTLYEHLIFMRTMKVTDWKAAGCFKKHFPQDADVALLNVLKINLKFPNFTNMKSVKYLIGLTCHGQIFYVSQFYEEHIKMARMYEECRVSSILHENCWYIYKASHRYLKGHVKLAKSKVMNNIISITKDKFSAVMDVISDNYCVFKDQFPAYMLIKENSVCFLDKLVYVCCMLHNIIS